LSARAWVLAALLAGCASNGDPCAGQPGNCLSVTITSTTVREVDTVTLTASGAFTGVRTSTTGRPSALPIRLRALYPMGDMGKLHLDVSASLAGVVVGQGFGETTVVAGMHPSVTVDLVGSGGDGGVPPGPDMIEPDMAHRMLAFTPLGTYTVTSNPIDVAIGNFQGKGPVDIVVADATGGNAPSAALLVQNSMGNYPASAPTVAIGLSAGGVGVGRWFAGASQQGWVMTDGRFSAAPYYNSGGSPPVWQATNGSSMLGQGTGAIAVGDFNKDNGDDVAYTVSGDNAGQPAIIVMICDKTGGFVSNPAPVAYEVGETPSKLATADLRGVGKLDLLVTKGLSTLGILSGNGDGSFNTTVDNHTVGSGPMFIAVADFNGDHKLDIAVANSAGGVSILINDGTGKFPQAGTPVSAGMGPSGIAAADFDGDGAIDLAVTNTGSGNVSVLLGDGHGGFATPKPFMVGGAPSAVATSDLNQDLKPDLVVTNQADATVTVLLNTTK
jgi:hypothetical protein